MAETGRLPVCFFQTGGARSKVPVDKVARAGAKPQWRDCKLPNLKSDEYIRGSKCDM